jgi:hypothetical protein
VAWSGPALLTFGLPSKDWGNVGRGVRGGGGGGQSEMDTWEPAGIAWCNPDVEAVELVVKSD